MSDATLQRIDGSALRFHLRGERDRPRSIVLLLHGSAASGDQFLPLAERLAVAIPDALFVLPDAPNASRDVMRPEVVAAVERERPDFDWERSRNWVRPVVAEREDQEAQRRAFADMMQPPIRALGRLADLLLARHELPPAALAVYGFSQGGMVAGHLGLDRAERCAGVVCHSGFFLGGLDVRSRPRMLLLVGSLELEPGRAASRIYPMAVSALRERDVSFEEHVCDGLGHGLNAEAETRIRAFLTTALAGDHGPGNGGLPHAEATHGRHEHGGRASSASRAASERPPNE